MTMPQARARCFYCDRSLADEEAHIGAHGKIYGPCCEDVAKRMLDNAILLCRRDGHDWQPTAMDHLEVCTRCTTSRHDNGFARRYDYPPGMVRRR